MNRFRTKRRAKDDTAAGRTSHESDPSSMPSLFRRGKKQQPEEADMSQGGSIMNRGKATEGNNLFGGRQKIYKIPAGRGADGGLVGRALYEDDVAVSSFQRWRKTEKEKSPLDIYDAKEEEDMS